MHLFEYEKDRFINLDRCEQVEIGLKSDDTFNNLYFQLPNDTGFNSYKMPPGFDLESLRNYFTAF